MGPFHSMLFDLICSHGSHTHTHTTLAIVRGILKRAGSAVKSEL